MHSPLLDPDEDRERRLQGVSLEDWLRAPAAPGVDRCEDGPRPSAYVFCPHLRCRMHLGMLGDGSYSCALDIAELPEEERTYERIARAMGVSGDRVAQIERVARDKFERQATPDLLRLLGLRRR